MKLIVGLGNPGKEYESTRHNLGFLVMLKLKGQMSNQYQISNIKTEKKFDADISQINNSEKILLAKPQTFMNNSGKAVKKIMDYYKINVRDLYVVCDDLDLKLGTIRIRKVGSSGGHKGLQSIIDQIGDNKFVRFRVGIATCDMQHATNREITAEKYVLQKFNKDERKIIKKTIDKTADLIVESLRQGVEEKTITINSNFKF